LHLIGGLLGPTDAVSQILPQTTPVTMLTKFKTKSAITRLVYEIPPRSLHLTGFWGSGYPIVYSNFKTTDPGCHDNEIWDKIGYNSVGIGNIADMLASSRGYSGSGY